MRRAYSFLLTFPFFTLGPDYRAALFKQIHQIVFHGKGGYSWSDVYGMPIWLRNFTFKEINEFYEKEKEAYDRANNSEKITANTDPKKLKPIPKVEVPTYVTTAKRPKK